MHQAASELGRLQQHLAQHRCLQPVDPGAVTAAAALFRSYQPQRSTRDVHTAPHAAATAAFALSTASQAPAAQQQVEALVSQLVASGHLEACSNVLLPLVACPAPAQAGSGNTAQMPATASFLEAALKLPGSQLPQLLTAALLLHLRPGAQMAPWSVLQGALSRQAPAGAVATGSAHQRQAHLLLAFIHKAALLAYLQPAGPQQQPPGRGELQQLVGQVPDLLRQLQQAPLSAAEVGGVLLELDALATAQDADGAEAVGTAAAVRAALGALRAVAAPPGGPQRSVAGAQGTAQPLGRPPATGLAWLYLHDGEHGLRMLPLLFRSGLAGGRAVAQQLLTEGPTWGPTRLSLALLALMHLASAEDVGAAHAVFRQLEASGEGRAGAAEAAKEALLVAAPHIGALLTAAAAAAAAAAGGCFCTAAADPRVAGRCAKLLVAAGLQLGSTCLEAGGAPLGSAPAAPVEWPGPAQAAVRPLSPADASFPPPAQVALHLLKYCCHWQAAFQGADPAAVAGAGSTRPAKPAAAATWLPMLLHVVASSSFRAGAVAAVHHVLLRAQHMQVPRGREQQWLQEDVAVACLRVDIRWWLVVAAVLVEQPDTMVAAIKRLVFEQQRLGSFEATRTQERELLGSIVAAAEKMADTQRRLLAGAGAAARPGGGQRSSWAAAARAPLTLPEVGLVLVEELQAEQLAVFFGPLEAQAALAWLLDCWRLSVEAVPAGALPVCRASLIRRIMQATTRVERSASRLQAGEVPVVAVLPYSLAALEAALAPITHQLHISGTTAGGALAGLLPAPEEALAVLGWRAAKEQAPAAFEDVERWQALWVEAIALALEADDDAQDGAAGAGGATRTPGELSGECGGVASAALEAWVGLLFACRHHSLLLNRCTGLLRERLEAGGRQHGGHSREAALRVGACMAEGLLHWGEQLLRWPSDSLVACCKESQGFFEVVAEQYALLCASASATSGSQEAQGRPLDANDTLLIPETEELEMFVPDSQDSGGPPPGQQPHRHHEQALASQSAGEADGRLLDGDPQPPAPILRLCNAFCAAVEARLSGPATYLAAAIAAEQDLPVPDTGSATVPAQAPAAAALHRGDNATGRAPTSKQQLDSALAVFAGACLNVQPAAARQLQQELVAQVEAAQPGASIGAVTATTRRGGCRAAARQMVACLAVTRLPGYQQALAALVELMGTPSTGACLLSRTEQVSVVACLVCQHFEAQGAEDKAEAGSSGGLQTEAGGQPPHREGGAMCAGAITLRGSQGQEAPGAGSRAQMGVALLLGGCLEELLSSCLCCPACRPGQVPLTRSAPGAAANGTAAGAAQGAGGAQAAEESLLAAWAVGQATTEGAAPLDEAALKLVHWRACRHVKQQVLQALQQAAQDANCSARARAAAGKLHGALQPTDVQLWLQSPPSSLNAPPPCHWITSSTSPSDLRTAAQVACLHLRDAPQATLQGGPHGSTRARGEGAGMRHRLAALSFLSGGLPCRRFAAEVLRELSASCHQAWGPYQLQAWQAAAASAACCRSRYCQSTLRDATSAVAAELHAATHQAALQDGGPPAMARALLLPALRHLASLAAAADAVAHAAPLAAAAARLHAAVAAALLCALQWNNHPVSAMPEGEEALLQLLDACVSALSAMAASCKEAAHCLVHDVLAALVHHQAPHGVQEAAGLALQKVLAQWGPATVLLPPPQQLVHTAGQESRPGSDSDVGMWASDGGGGIAAKAAAGWWGNGHNADRHAAGGGAAFGGGTDASGAAAALAVARAVPIAAIRLLALGVE